MFSHRHLIALFALAHMALAGSAVAEGTIVDDEGYLAWLGAHLTWAEPLAGLFSLKLHPLTSATLAPLSTLGWQAWLWAHVLLSGLAVALLGDAARRAGGQGALAAALAAGSPALVVGAMAGHSNVVGVLAQALALWLYSLGPRRTALLGLVLGALPLFRWELAVPAALLAAVALWQRPAQRARLSGALLTVPLAYAGGAALYHGDALFWLHMPPSLPRPVPMNAPSYGFPSQLSEGVGKGLQNLALALPVWPLALAAARPGRLSLGRVGALIGLASVAGVIAVPLLEVFTDTPQPRYLLVALPGLALAIASVRWPRPASAAIVAAALLALAWTFDRPQERWGLGWIRLTDAEAGAVAAMGSRSGPALTNNMRIALTLAEQGRQVGFLPSHDVHYELYDSFDHRGEHYDRLVDEARRSMLGGAVFFCDLAARPLPAGTWLVVDDDHRRRLILPDAALDAGSVVVQRVDGVQLRRTTGARVAPRWPAGLSKAVFARPCQRATAEGLRPSGAPAPSP